MNARWTGLPLIVALTVTAFGQNDALNQGVTLFRNGRYEEALQQFRKAAIVQTKNAQIENLIGITETKLGRIAQGNTAFRRAIQVNPSYEPAHKNLGFNYLQSQDYARAEEELKKALTLDPSDAFAHYYLVSLYLKTSREADTVVHLAPAAALISNDAGTAYLQAVACLEKNLACGDLTFLGEVEKNGGFSREQEFRLAGLFYSRQMYEKALAYFRHLESIQTNSWAAKYNLAVVLLAAGKSPEALPLLEEVVRERASEKRAWSLLGSAYEAAGKMPEALEAYSKVLAADPENSDAYLDYARLLMDVDRFDDAAALIQRGIHALEDTYALDIRMGAIELMRGQPDKAEDAFRKAIREHPEIAVGHVALAKAYMKEGRDQDALKVLAEARNKVPQDFALEYVFGLESAAVGNENDALTAMTNAAQMRPDMVEPHYQIGKLCLDSGDLAQARRELEIAVTLDPAQPQVQYELSRLYRRLGDMPKAQAAQSRATELINAQRKAGLDAQSRRLAGFHPMQDGAFPQGPSRSN